MENGTHKIAGKRSDRSVLRSLMKAVMIIFFMLPSHAFSFNVPERLEFDLKWIGIPGGTAVLSVENSNDTYIIRSRALSNDFVSTFFKVDDRIKCVVDGTNGDYGYSIKYHIKIREGGYKRNKEVHFDQKGKKVLYIDHRKKKRRKYEVPTNVYDPLSGFYSVRKKDLVVGKDIIVKVFDDKKTWDVNVDVLRKEKVTVEAGTFDTIVIRPNLQSEGVFNKKGDIFIWLTDDERRVPVKVALEVLVGHITAELTGGVY
jgi:hypothetical protein